MIDMYSVSLLPSEYKALNVKAKKNKVGLYISAIALICIMFVYFYFFFLSAKFDGKLDELKDESAQLSKKVKKLEPLEALSNSVAQQLGEVLIAWGNKPVWDDLISSIGNSVPETISISNMSFKYTEQVGECIIQGDANSHNDVSFWMQQIESISGIGEIKCKDSSEDEGDIHFELSIILLPGQGYQLPLEVLSDE